MTRKNKMFTVSWYVYSDFLQEPTWSRAIVIVTNTQLLHLLKQRERELTIKPLGYFTNEKRLR